MKQVLQNVRSGAIAVHDVPEPMPRDGFALVAVRHSLISAGTERASAALGSKSLLQKARARPDLVKQVVGVARAEGVAAAAAKVRSRLEQYTAFGYSAAGELLDAGGDARLRPGQLVACVGAGYASHAEVDSVPSNLVVPLPVGVSTDEGAFSAPAAIALHAIRLADVGPGSTVVVVGLGLIGQLAVRLLEASGCTALGTDPREDRRALAGRAAAAGGVGALVDEATRGRGADGVLVAAATPSSEPVELAADLARDRAHVVVVGDVGLDLDRRVFYEKELSLVVARSYGPGRYERAYEERGLDFPIGHVRWTETRNVEAVLDLVASGRLRLADLVTHRFPVERGEEAFSVLQDEPSALGILLEYEPGPQRRTTIAMRRPAPRDGSLRVAVVGAGNFARGTLVPALQEADAAIAAVCARSGAGAKALADKVGAATVTTDWRSVVASADIDAVVIATPHAEHADMAVAALEAGKAVFVEKPLAVSWDGLARVALAAAGGGLLLVGHNRRFAPLVRRLRDAAGAPAAISIRVAAGPLPHGHWLEDPEQGGRILGEISHFVDLAAWLGGGVPERVFATTVPVNEREESLVATLALRGGSAATIVYGVGPAAGLAKERIEVLGAAGAATLDDFARLELHGAEHETVKGHRDKGHGAQIAAWAAAARGEAPPPVPVEEQLLVAAASLALLDSARTGAAVDVRLPG